MRNLDECRAEVFRRSEARIRARNRRRNAVLAACVPVVLCVVIGLAVGLPERAAEAPGEYGAVECATEVVMVMPVAGQIATDDKQNAPESPLYGFLGGDIQTDFPGVEVRVVAYSPENGGTLTVVWENKTEYEVMYGAEYTVMRRGEDCWVSCQRRGDLAFEALGYLLMPGQTKTEVYSLAYTYDASAPGVYRFESSCFVQNTPNESAKCTLSAEFTVE